jgi:hypothetical protein
MRIAIAVLAAALISGAASASDCRGDLIQVTDWKLQKVTGLISGIDIHVTIKSNFSKPIRMIDGTYTFADALGRRISSFGINPDLNVEPGKTVKFAHGYMGREMDRVLKMNRADVIVTTCVRAVVYQDGTKETFTARKASATSASKLAKDEKTKAIQDAAVTLALAYECAPITGDHERYERAKTEAGKLLSAAGVKKPSLNELIESVERVPRGENKIDSQICRMLLPAR